MKLWGGRFRKEENKLMEDFNSSLHVDQRLYAEDIKGSVAHVNMLAHSGLLTRQEGEEIVKGLLAILEEIEAGTLEIGGNYEDIHSFVEAKLTERIGATAKKLHTARSRNDQVAVDIRLYAKNKAHEVMQSIEELQASLEAKARENNVIMPGYTHLQRAQVVTFQHHLMAYYQMLRRDKLRIANAIEIMNESPLGCGALAGTTHRIDRR